MVKQMTAKDLHIAVKRQDGIEYLLKRFSLESQESLFDVIRRVVPEHSEWFVKELTKNQRKKRNPATTETIQINEPILEEKENSEPETFDIEEEDKAVRLEELLREEDEMSCSLCLLEGLHKELSAKRHAIRANLESEKDSLVALREEAAKRKKNILRLHDEYMQCAEEMRRLNEDMRANEELLAEVRKAIEEARRVVVLVYDTGIIEIENANMPEISDEQVKAQFDMLLSMPEAEELTIKCVKCVAKLRVIMPEFPDAELIFDSELVKALYEA